MATTRMPELRLCLAGTCLLLLLMTTANAAAPDYVSKPTWAETMLACRAQVLASFGEKPFRPTASPVLHGAEEPVLVAADVSGLDTLCLFATIGGDDYNYDQAIWGEPTLVAADGTQTRLTELQPAAASVGWGSLSRDVNHAGRPLTAGTRTFAFGFWAHAPSELRFDLAGRFVRFEAWVGIDAGAGKNGSVSFVVSDGRDTVSPLWRRIQEDFPEESAFFARDAGEKRCLTWFENSDNAALEQELLSAIAGAVGEMGAEIAAEQGRLAQAGTPSSDPAWLELYLYAVRQREELLLVRDACSMLDVAALRLARDDLAASFPETYHLKPDCETRLIALEQALPRIQADLAVGKRQAYDEAKAGIELAREILLSNPLLDFEEMVVVRRSDTSPALGLPQNWQGNCSLPKGVYSNEIALLSWREQGANPWRTVFRAAPEAFAGDVDLNFDADKMLFSMPDRRGRFQIWEIAADGSGLRQVTPGEEADVDNYDACYLPDGRVVFASTACYHGIPCVFGGDSVANLCLLGEDGKTVRELCFDQDHNWCPTVQNNGQIMYLRWEYGDLPHSNSRILFHMNPDGTNQMEYYGSNSYWPNGIFFARPVPGHPTQFAGIVTGHHGVRRMGELCLFDTALGRAEAEGAIQRIPGRGKLVEPVIKDRLADDSWPKFLHPYPLSSKYFIVAAQPTPKSRWGIYLADVFDNMLLLREEPGQVLFEPIPLRKTPRPTVLPDRVKLDQQDSLVYLADVYRGPGLAGVPRGAVKALRLFAYNFSFRGMGGLLGTVGMDGPWDVKCVLGTVPVEGDGSAFFRVPANTPISVQPLDAEGKAMQVMRSWFTAMPGETLSCVGCHDRQNMSPPEQATIAARRAPSDIAPWYGPARGFSFAREVQPVLDRHCTGCHSGETAPDLRGTEKVTDWKSDISGHAGTDVGGKFSVAYAQLQRYVRRPGIESDIHILSPMDYHADTTELVQMLQRGHYGVALDEEAWSRIATWIDLNAPYHGSWTDLLGKGRVAAAADRRCALRKKYAGVDTNPEAMPPPPEPVVAPQNPVAVAADAPLPTLEDWPWPPDAARARQEALGQFTRTIDLADGVALQLALVPAGTFVMGDPAGGRDERPASVVHIPEPFWIGAYEVSNEQYAQFDPAHDSHVESKHGYQFGVHGYPLNEPNQPVVRVSCEEAAAFCDWLAARTGEPFTLPTEAQWEYACRAGSATAFYFGDTLADFSPYANLGEVELARFASNPYLLDAPLSNPNPYDDWIPRDTRFSDGGFLSAALGAYHPNPWGLYDMHGNVWEWTISPFGPYPYAERDGHEAGAAQDKIVVRGGSWYDRPYRCTAAYRLAYRPWQRVFNVGFRVACPATERLAANQGTGGVR